MRSHIGLGLSVAALLWAGALRAETVMVPGGASDAKTRDAQQLAITRVFVGAADLNASCGGATYDQSCTLYCGDSGNKIYKFRWGHHDLNPYYEGPDRFANLQITLASALDDGAENGGELSERTRKLIRDDLAPVCAKKSKGAASATAAESDAPADMVKESAHPAPEVVVEPMVPGAAAKKK